MTTQPNRQMRSSKALPDLDLAGWWEIILAIAGLTTLIIGCFRWFRAHKAYRSLVKNTQPIQWTDLRRFAVPGQRESHCRYRPVEALLGSQGKHPLTKGMLAPYRCGRQFDALRVFQRLRNALKQVGLAPSIEAFELDRSIVLDRLELQWSAPDSIAN